MTTSVLAQYHELATLKKVPAMLTRHQCRKTFIVKSSKLILCCFVFFISAIANGQSFEGLQLLEGFKTQTYYSKGAEEKAIRIAKQLDNVMSYYQSLLQFTPSVTLLLLSPQDWSKHTQFPVYGMPHYTNNQTLVVATEDNDFWRNGIPPLAQLTKEEAQLFTQTYTNSKGTITLESFFDLLAIHELGHAYQNQGGLTLQRKWLGELFSNILLHTYIAEKEPALLPTLTIFPKALVAATNKSTLTYTTLDDLETYYNELGKVYPQNYAWYQCRWHMASDKVYEQSKIMGIQNLWNALKSQKELLNNQALAEMLNTKVDKSVANVLLQWHD